MYKRQAYQTVVMSERYITDRFLPDKAIDLLDEACSDVNLHNAALSRLAAVKKDRADLNKEKELLLSEISKQDEKRNDALTENEQKQARARQELSALNQARRTIVSDPTMTEEDRRNRLETNDARRSLVQRTLDGLTRERETIQGQSVDKSYERLAYIRAEDMRLEQEQQELESKPWPPISRSIIQTANAYLYNNTVCVDFNEMCIRDSHVHSYIVILIIAGSFIFHLYS